jgi:hypothetical protein
MQITRNYQVVHVLGEAAQIKHIAEQFRALLLADLPTKLDSDLHVEVRSIAESMTDFHVNVCCLKIYAQFELITRGADQIEFLMGRYCFRIIDVFGNVGEPFYKLHFDMTGGTKGPGYASMMYGNELNAANIRNAHLLEIAKAAIAMLPND